MGFVTRVVRTPALLSPAHFAPVAGAGLLVAASVGMGALVANAGVVWEDNSEALLIALGAVIGLAVLRSGAVGCIAVIAGLAASGADFPLGSVGELDIVAPDILYAGALAWWAAAAVGRLVDPSVPREPSPRFGQWAALAFLAFGGVSLYYVWSETPGGLDHSAVSWLRFVQTASLAFLAAAVIRSRRDLVVVLAAIAAGALVAVGSGIVEVIEGTTPIGGRVSGMHGPNELALVSGMLVLIATFAVGRRRPALCALLIVAGVISLLLAKSVGVFVGTGAALAVGAAFSRAGSGLQRASSFGLAVVVAAALVIGAVQLLRPDATPGSSGFNYNSTSQRVIVGAAGIEIFERNPVIGVGWRRSDAPDVIGARDINIDLRHRFPGARQDFFPDVTPASVHNTYVQVLAELGLVGFVLFAVMLVAIFAGVRRVLRGVPPGDPLWGIAWAMGLSLLLVLVWFNENPLYGGQVDTILAATLIGCLARMSVMVERRRGAAA
jgi:O-antigen ligase